ncbi:CLIP domain-containing serine protease HP8 [Onthophagus taurus]|uniref:CLIP domain-containing serine protease HP8 n=1 Tax=Onthophagus taurus TaxID=166361 RepID=UPI000C20B480|nr:serine protease easter [Onthophagus taurus]
MLNPLILVLNLYLVSYFTNAEQCYTPNQQLGECVVITQCQEVLDVLVKRPISVEDTEYLKKAGCGFEGLTSKVCCSLRQQPPTSTSNPRNYQSNDDLLPDTSTCGVDNQNRILGGSIADLEEYPWMALIEYKTKSGSGFYCGGVLINDRYVLTAAHCVKGKDLPSTWKLISVRLGEFNTSSPVDCVTTGKHTRCSPEPVDVPVEQQIAHESYDPQSLDQYHDIALLRLASRVSYTDFVRPVCLPTIETHLRSSYQDEILDVVGWGKTENRSASDVKLKLRIRVQSNEQCSPIYRAARISISEGQLCAGGAKGQDSCRGDSGGPLMGGLSNGPVINTYVLGVVSFGPTPCGMEGWPGVYTRVSKYVDWIKQKLRP